MFSLTFGASIDSPLRCQLIVCLSVLIFQSEISITQYWYSIVKYPLCVDVCSTVVDTVELIALSLANTDLTNCHSMVPGHNSGSVSE